MDWYGEVGKKFWWIIWPFIREQFLNMCTAEIALFLEERVPKMVEEMVSLAEQFMEAHKTEPKADRKTQDRLQSKCFLCHRTGHTANKCKPVKPLKPQQERFQEAAWWFMGDTEGQRYTASQPIGMDPLYQHVISILTFQHTTTYQSMKASSERRRLMP